MNVLSSSRDDASSKARSSEGQIIDSGLSPLDEVAVGDAFDFASDDLDPFTVDDLLASNGPAATRISGTDDLGLRNDTSSGAQSASVVRGVSLSAVLQMPHMERKSCVLDVTADRNSGTLTLVNGELTDAETAGLSGADAVYQILGWHRPQATIIEGVSLFRHTVALPIRHLLMEAVRRQDEVSGTGHGTGEASSSEPRWRFSAGETGDTDETWSRLVETLIINGALFAAVVRARDEGVIAVANEFGRLPADGSATRPRELTPILRTMRNWSHLVDPTVDEMVVRIEGQQSLVRPLDANRSLFAWALIDSAESLELARHAITSAAQ